MDVQCGVCGGVGCPVCKGTGWIEILGSGMVHPAVLEASGVDSERYTGWAFGMGPARIAISRYAIPDIRLLYDSDVRFLDRIAE
jgi:phenylalanyl-tRNA synthetase alpha chain